MKKKVLGLALIAMSLVAANSFAQTTATTATSSVEKKERVCNSKDGNCKSDRAARVGKGDKANRPCPFDGLNLTDAQKQKLQQLQEKQRTARQAQKQQRQEQKQARKAERQKADSTLKAQRIQERKQYLQEVKAIIGQEQYVTYLENIAASKDLKANKDGKKPGKKGGKKDGKKNGKKNGHQTRQNAQKPTV